jgi:putative flippase GtrA
MNRGIKFVIVGLILTITQYLFYLFFALVIFNNNDILWLSSGISYIIATILAFVLHSRITWKERPPKKNGILMFFAWNLLTALVIAPFLTWFFKLFTPTYNFFYSLSFSMGLSLTYEFVESTLVFILVILITLTLNYFFYDKLVFGDQKKSNKIKAPVVKTVKKKTPAKKTTKKAKK